MKDVLASPDRVKAGDFSSIEGVLTAEMRAKANRNSELFEAILMQCEGS